MQLWRHRGRLLVPLVVAFLAGPAAWASAAERPTYIVRLKAPPVASYTGGSQGIRATSPAVTGRKIDRSARAVAAYRARLADRQASALARLGGGAPQPIYSYRYAFAGFAVPLSPDQVRQLRAAPEVAAIDKAVLQRVTAVSPEEADAILGARAGDGAGYLRLPTGLWQRLGGTDHAGESVIVGVFDTGITPEHPSFADNGEGYLGPPYTAPEVWDGVCEAGERFSTSDCGRKLIGARYFVGSFGAENLADTAFLSPRDDDGHGSHTAATAAGNFGVDPVIDGNDLGVDRISGIAPRAYVAAYKVCWPGRETDGCDTADSVAAIDAAVADGVDVINYSVGSPTSTVLPPDAVAFLGAADAGVFVANSAGNDGPAEQTVGSPASVPWVTTVAASTLSRTFEATVTVVSGDATVTARGASVTNALPASPMADAAASAAEGVDPAVAELCKPDTLDPAKVAGHVVLCKRGDNPRVEKSKVVKDAGGVGMILYNASDAEELVTDTHWVPSVHVTHADGLAIKAAIAPGAAATLTTGTAAPARGGVLAAFSSRGPQTAAPDIPKPDVTAPGVNILAAASPFPAPAYLRPGELFQSMSGTSMAAPHVAGAAALLTQLHPTWSPAALKSALMTTANPDVLREDAATPAAPFDAGSGEIDPNRAADPGLVLEEDTPDYLGYLKGQRPECTREFGIGCLEAIGFTEDEIAAIRELAPTDLNLPAISDADIAGSLETTRVFTSVATTARRWSATVEGLAGVTATVSPRRFKISPGESQQVSVAFSVNGAAPDQYTTGALVVRGGDRTVRVPITLSPVVVSAPARIAVDADTDSGSAPLEVTSGIAGTVSGVGWGLGSPDVASAERVTGASPAPDLSGSDPGTRLYPVTVPEGSQLLAAATSNVDNGDPGTDLDLYLYRDANGDGVFDPATELVAVSGSPAADESIEMPLPEPGDYLFAVVGFAIQPSGSVYDFTEWLVNDPQPDDPAPPPGITVTGDPVEVTPGEAVPLTLNWSTVSAPGTYLGVVTYHDGTDSAPATAADLSVVAVTRRSAASRTATRRRPERPAARSRSRAARAGERNGRAPAGRTGRSG